MVLAMQNLKCRKIRGSHHGRRANFLRKQAEVCVFRELLRSDWSLFYKHGVKKRRIACAFLKQVMQMNVFVSAVLFLFIGPFDRASSWEAKTTGEPY